MGELLFARVTSMIEDVTSLSSLADVVDELEAESPELLADCAEVAVADA